MTRTMLVALVVLTYGCATDPIARLSGQTGYVVPLRGQTEAKLADDKYQCFEGARAPRGAVTARATETGYVGTGAAGFVGGAAATEIEELRRNPPDLVKYRACMTERGYEVHP